MKNMTVMSVVREHDADVTDDPAYRAALSDLALAALDRLAQLGDDAYYMGARVQNEIDQCQEAFTRGIQLDPHWGRRAFEHWLCGADERPRA